MDNFEEEKTTLLCQKKKHYTTLLTFHLHMHKYVCVWSEYLRKRANKRTRKSVLQTTKLEYTHLNHRRHGITSKGLNTMFRIGLSYCNSRNISLQTREETKLQDPR